MALSNHTKKSNIVYLVSEGGTKLCRALLLNRVEQLRPADINQNWSMSKFLELKKKKILQKLNASSKNTVFPLAPVEINLEKWDVCVFCCVLKEACELGPELKMFLDQLKKIRNKFFHWSDSPIDDNKYDETLEKLKVIFGKILDELKDDDLRGKINDIFNKVETGEIPDDELSRILEAIDKTNEQVKHAHEDTRNFVSDEHLETRNIIIKGNKGMEEKLNTFIEFFTSKFIEQSAKVNENAPEAVGIEIGVRNCGNIEMEKNFSVMMVKLFNDEIRKVPDLSNLPDECQMKLREIIHKICQSFEEKGYTIQNARQKCILLEIQCTSMIAFMRLYRDYINGSLDLYFNELQTAVQSMDCFEEVCLETIMYEDDFLRTIDFHNIQASQKDETMVDERINKSENEDCDSDAHGTQSGDEKSNKILLQVIPGTRVEPQELERIIAMETKDLAQRYGLSFHTKIFLGNVENQQTTKPAAQVSQELNIIPDNENEHPEIATGEGSAKTKVSENFVQGGIFEYDSEDKLKEGGVTFKDSEEEKGTRKKKKKGIGTKKSENREKTVYNSKVPSIKEQENILSDLLSKLDCFIVAERQSLNCNLHEKSKADLSRLHRQQVGLLNNSFEKSIDGHIGKIERGEKTKLTHETNKISDMVDENEVFKFVVKSLEGHGTPEEIKRKSGLFPAEINALQWFREHRHRFLLLGRDDSSCTVVAFCKQATYCKFYLTSRSCTKDCGRYHICEHLLFGDCKFGERKCKFSHDFLDERNFKVSNELGFSKMFTSDEICSLMQLQYPHVCQKWAATGFCNSSDCLGLHLCPRYLLGTCWKGSDCPLLHDTTSPHNQPIICAYGISDWPIALLRENIYISRNVCGQEKADVLTEHHKPIQETSKDDLIIRKKYLNRTDVLDTETSDQASYKYICEDHIIDKCYRPKCRKMHTATKMPYLWQVRLYKKWTNLQNSEQVEEEYCESADSTFGCLERHNNVDFLVSVNFDKTQTAFLNNLSDDFSTIICNWRRLSTMSYTQGDTNNEGFKTQWRWYWKDDQRKWNLFEPDSVQHTLERKFLAKQEFYYFAAENYIMNYMVDFKSMSLLKLKTREKQDLLRRPIFVSSKDVKNGKFGCSLAAAPVVDTKLPKDWVPWDLAQSFELVRLDKSTPDYNTVADSFYSTLKRTEQKIDYIYHMQNPKLWSLFCKQEKIMEANLKRVGKDCQVATRYLFHGSDSLDAVRAICINNFDARVSGKNATMYGYGAYFARDAVFSHSYTNPPARFMFMVKVLVGEYTKGDKSYRRPPQKPGSNHELFDSCVNDESNPSIFIVFDKNQCYPEYLIEYRHVRDEIIDETTRASVFHALERTPSKGSPPLSVRNRGYPYNSHQGDQLSPSISKYPQVTFDSTRPGSQTGSFVSALQRYPDNPARRYAPDQNVSTFRRLYTSSHSSTAELSLFVSTSKTTSGEDQNDFKNSGENSGEITDSGNEDDDNEDHGEEDTNEVDECSDDNSMASDYERFDDDDDDGTKAKTPELVLKSYQVELTKIAVMGMNTIVCAETGSGKTWVALHIIKDHLQKAWNGPRKVVFMARTSARIKQQFDRFNKYLPQFNSKLITADDDESRLLDMLLEQEYDILCFTPQILVNNLDSKAIKSLCEFSLLVLDEYHHTRGDEPYNRLMRRYLIEKQKGATRLPQVVVLTAFIGVGKSRTEAEAMDYILRVCASLDVELISTVERNIVELRKHTNMPEEETIPLMKLPNDPCKNIIIKAMEDIEDMLHENAFLQPELIELITDKHPRNKESQEYNKWTVDVMKQAEVKVHNHEISRDISTCAKYLNIYNSALEINKLLPTRDVIKFLAEKLKLESEHKRKLTPMERELFQNLLAVQKEINREARDVENPNVRILSNTLRKMINKKGEDSRAMVFVKARATCKALAAFLDKDMERIAVKASLLYGKESRGGDDGMTERVKKHILDRFRKGYFKILVCTSVGNEGIDVPDCNIVLSYENSADEVTKIQMKGRARKHGATAVVMGSEAGLEQDRTNAFKAAMMYKALAKVKKLDPNVVRRKVAMFQKEETNKYQWKVDIEQMKKGRISEKDYKILCMRCNTVACYASDVRKMGHDHIVIDRDFADKINRKPHPKPKLYDGLYKKYKMFCKKCPLDWGIIGTRDGLDCMILKIINFKFLNLRTNSIETYKKWIDLPYQVQEITLEDLPRLIEETVPKDQTD